MKEEIKNNLKIYISFEIECNKCGIREKIYISDKEIAAEKLIKKGWIIKLEKDKKYIHCPKCR